MNVLVVLNVDEERVCGGRLEKRGRGSLLFYSLDDCLHKLKVWKERKFVCLEKMGVLDLLHKM